MFDIIRKILKEKNIFSHLNDGVTIATVANLHEGFSLAKEILYQIIDPKTVLYLSGGSTPEALYEKLAQEEKLSAGAVGIVDERFGPKFHDKSNEKMIRDTGLLRYLEMRDIPFYPILTSHPESRHSEFISESHGILKQVQDDKSVQHDNERELVAKAYDEKLRELNANYQKSVAIMGIGSDGHTAGIPSLKSNLKDQISKIYDMYDLVTEYADASGKYGERVTMTFLALSMMDVLLVLAFGSGKKEAIELMFSSPVGPRSEKEIPASFFRRPEIAKKTLLITDQTI
jgi:6-phosphogluconolactonase/glucosamine-6-phosphate isomerase/deaminase